MSRVLILGGTSEAQALASALHGDARFDPILSLAGRTSAPRLPDFRARIGGFGGVEGLARYLKEMRIDAVIDATHPYAARMSCHAAEACARAGVRLAGMARPAWQAGPGDRWVEVGSMDEAVISLGPVQRRVFLTIGGLGLPAFAAAPWHFYLIRTIEPPAVTLPQGVLLLGRGPFDASGEMALMRAHRIEILATKNSGGAATAAKLAAARALGLPVVMVRRPDKPAIARLDSPGAVVALLAHPG